MSPSEFQLRAALRDGEDGGGSVDPDAIIAHARTVRHDRRVRYGTAAAAAAVVAGIGIAGGVALTGNTTNNSAASKADLPAARDAAGGAVATGPSAASGGDAGGGAGTNSATGAGCGDKLPSVPLPDPTGSRSPSPLLPENGVASLTICAYSQQTGQPLVGPGDGAVTTTLTGRAAEEVVASLNNAATAVRPDPCPLYRTTAAQQLSFRAVTDAGRALPPVIATVDQNPCNLPLTNGKTVRYDWQPPRVLAQFLAQVRAAANTEPLHRTVPPASGNS